MNGEGRTGAAGASVLLDVEDGVGLVTLNRPDRMNAVDESLQDGFVARMNEAADREDVRVIVLTGAGRGFCAGADLGRLGSIGDGGDVVMPGRELLVARTIPKPVIAAVNGACAGLGLVFALTCDYRFASTSAKFVTGFAQRGLVAEQGLAWLLGRQVGPSRAMELLMSSRKVDADEALRLGIVDAVHGADELLSAVLAHAKQIARTSSPVSMGVIKWQVQRATESGLWDALDDADEATRRSLRGRDFVEVGSRLRPGDTPRFAAIPPGRLDEQPPVHLIPLHDREQEATA